MDATKFMHFSILLPALEFEFMNLPELFLLPKSYKVKH